MFRMYGGCMIIKVKKFRKTQFFDFIKFNSAKECLYENLNFNCSIKDYTI